MVRQGRKLVFVIHRFINNTVYNTSDGKNEVFVGIDSG